MAYEISFKDRDPAYVVYKKLTNWYKFQGEGIDLSNIKLQNSTIILYDNNLLSDLENIIEKHILKRSDRKYKSKYIVD